MPLISTSRPGSGFCFDSSGEISSVNEPTSVCSVELAVLNARKVVSTPTSSVAVQAPDAGSHTFTVPPLDLDASRPESGEKATDLPQKPWLLSVDVQVADVGSHSFTVPSSNPDASRRQSAEKATDVTESPCVF
jgi:hypothetical protein